LKAGRKIASGLLAGLLGGLVALGLSAAGLLERWENTTWDWRARIFARSAPTTSAIRLILLDQKSLDWGKEVNGWSWPWPREVYGVLAAFLERAGARAGALDVLFTEPSFYGVGDDDAFFSALTGPVPFVGALALSRETGPRASFPPGLPGVPLRGKGWEKAGELPGLRFASLTLPVEGLYSVCRVLANVTDVPDPDSVFRRAALVGMLSAEPAPSLGLGTWLAGNGGGDVSYSPGRILLGGRSVPLAPDGRCILRFRGPLAVYEPISAAAVIRSELLLREGGEPEISPDFFRDRYVFFGFSAPGLLDLRATPLSPVAPGVVVHATVLDNLLGGDFIRPTPAAAVVIWTLLVALAASTAMIFCRRAWQSALAAAVLVPMPWAVGFALYDRLWWWPVVAPAAAAVLALAGAMLINYATEGRQKAYIKGAFKHYLSPAVIERLIEDPSSLALGGEKRLLTIFFSDLEGFSSFSEKLGPVELTGLLNDYLTAMTDIILEEGGTLDKYVGDAVIAFWNAPLAQPDHAQRALRAAVRCQETLSRLREGLRERYGALLRMRIGLNTGEVVVGNMGSRERFDYTMLGDAANLASRLEGANKAFGTYTMVSETAWEASGGVFPGRCLGRIKVVGRARPIGVFEPLGGEGAAAPPGAEAFAAGLEACRKGDWAGAAELFSSLPDDPAAAAYLAKVRALAGRGPDAWDGVWNLTSK